MDKKKTLARNILILLLSHISMALALGQNIGEIKFCDKSYEYGPDKDSVTLYFNILDPDGRRVRGITSEELRNYLVVREDGKLVPNSRSKVNPVSTGRRIPAEYTFSVLVDRSIPEQGKMQIYQTVGQLVESAPEGCVYLSFFGDEVSSSVLVTRENFASFKEEFSKTSQQKYFYGALYAKLAEFSDTKADLEDAIVVDQDYARNPAVSGRAKANQDKNILFVFTDGNHSPSFEESIGFLEVTEYQQGLSHIVPVVYAFYYTQDGKNAEIENVLKGVCDPHVEGRAGDYKPADDMAQVLADFRKIVNDRMYDYAFAYEADHSRIYSGKTRFSAEWKGDAMGEEDFSIGSAEKPWPERSAGTSDAVLKFIVALLVTLLTIGLFFLIMKILVPLCRSKAFEVKYYKKYVPEPNVSHRICHYCRQEILPGQTVVAKCRHIMHVDCWKQNGYKCAEYGQNCKDGIQEHLEWKGLFSKRSFSECHQTIAGIFAGFISWIVFELGGRGSFNGISQKIASLFYSPTEGFADLSVECVTKTSSFMTIGLLLGFFLSLIFRYNDEYRKKDWKISLKIIGLSLFTGMAGMLAFTVGAAILCLLLTAIHPTFIPWYCSFPAYLLFSVCVTLALTVKSSIPLKSALLGGGCSAVIGFMVLCLSSLAGRRWPWMNMLLDFIIYGGGLGASLVTVRMLAEKYFLVIQNGVKAGQRIPIHKWMNATGGGNKVSIGMTGDCEIQMNWEKSNKVAKEHAQLYIDHERQLPMIRPQAPGIVYNARVELPAGKPAVLSNGDTFKIGDTVFQYVETD